MDRDFAPLRKKVAQVYFGMRRRTVRRSSRRTIPLRSWKGRGSPMMAQIPVFWRKHRFTRGQPPVYIRLRRVAAGSPVHVQVDVGVLSQPSAQRVELGVDTERYAELSSGGPHLFFVSLSSARNHSQLAVAQVTMHAETCVGATTTRAAADSAPTCIHRAECRR